MSGVKNSRKQAVRNAFLRAGLHTPPGAIVHALRGRGIDVGEAVVWRVRLEMLKHAAGAWRAPIFRPVPTPAVQRRPGGFPGRRGGR